MATGICLGSNPRPFRFSPLISNYLLHLLSAKITHQRGTPTTSSQLIHKPTCLHTHPFKHHNRSGVQSSTYFSTFSVFCLLVPVLQILLPSQELHWVDYLFNKLLGSVPTSLLKFSTRSIATSLFNPVDPFLFYLTSLQYLILMTMACCIYIP